jgi:hypothetical protein
MRSENFYRKITENSNAYLAQFAGTLGTFAVEVRSATTSKENVSAFTGTP